MTGTQNHRDVYSITLDENNRVNSTTPVCNQLDAAVKSGRIDIVDKIIKNREYENEFENVNFRNLFEIALQYGQLSVIQYLIENKVVKMDNEDTADMLHALFDNEHPYLSDEEKSNQTVKNIYEYLTRQFKEFLFDMYLKDSLPGLIGGDNKYINVILELKPELIHYQDRDEHGLVYYALRNKLETLADQLLKHGATLSDHDKMTLEQNNIVNDLLIAIQKNNNEDKSQLLKKLIEYSSKHTISRENIHACVKAVIAKNDLASLKALLEIRNAEKIILHFIPKNLEAARLLIEYGVHHDTETAHGNLYSFVSEFGHKMGLGGDVIVDKKSKLSTEGSTDIAALPLLNDALKGYDDTSKLMQNISSAVQFTMLSQLAITSESDKEAEAIRRSLYFERYDHGDPVVLFSGWHSHCIGLSLQYDKSKNTTYISISNRGDGYLDICFNKNAKADQQCQAFTKKTGTIVYAMEGELEKEFFEHFSTGKQRLAYGAAKDSFVDDIMTTLQDAHVIAILPAMPQKYGTCAYVNFKRTIEGYLFTQDMIANNNVELAKKNAYAQYKKFSSHDRDQCCMKLMQLHQKNEEWRPILNQLIYQFILNHHSYKDDAREIHRAQLLFKLLPQELKDNLKLFTDLPKEITTTGLTDLSTTNVAIFFQRKQGQENKIIIKPGERCAAEYFNSQSKLVAKLLELLSPEIKKKIVEITINASPSDSLTIGTLSNSDVKESRQIKADIRKECELKLGEKFIVNVQGYYMFQITNISEIQSLSLNPSNTKK